MHLDLSVKYNEQWYSELLDYKKKLNIHPKAFSDAIRIFELSHKNKLSSGRSIKILVLASLKNYQEIIQNMYQKEKLHHKKPKKSQM